MLEFTTPRRRELFAAAFLLSLCTLFWWLGTGSLTWKRMGIPLVFAAVCCWQRRAELPRAPRLLLLPVLAALYTLFSPGEWFVDRLDGGEMLLAYLAGLAAVLFAGKNTVYAMLCLPLALTLTFAGHALGLFSKPMLTDDNRLTLYLSHPNILGGVAAWGLLILAAYRDRWRGIWLYAALGTGLVSALVLVLSASRAALLGCLIGLAFLLIPFLKRHALAAVAVVVLAGAGVTFVLPQQQLNRLEAGLTSPLSDRTLETRKPIWEATLAGIERAPVLGNGIGSFKAFHRAYVAEHAQQLDQRYAEVEREAYHPHNMLLGLLFMSGIAGTALLLAAVVMGLRLAWLCGDRFFPTTVLYYLTFGMFEFPLDREDGIIMLFFPLGLVFGKALLCAGTGQNTKTMRASAHRRTEC